VRCAASVPKLPFCNSWSGALRHYRTFEAGAARQASTLSPLLPFFVLTHSHLLGTLKNS